MAEGLPQPTRMSVFKPPPASRLAVLRTLLRWAPPLVAYFAWWFVRLRQPTLHERGARIRQVVESMGLAGRVIGRLGARRMDILPVEVCLGLQQVDEEIDAFPLEVALARLEAASQGPVGQWISRIDPIPIRSTAIACTWLAELTDGRRARIMVRRPGIGQELSAAVGALSWAMRPFEWSGVTSAALGQRLRNELRRVMLDELNFRWLARLQLTFAERAERFGPKWVSASEVVRPLIAEDVLVVVQPEGVLLSELIDAVERQDDSARARLAGLGIKPKKVGQRLLGLGWWEQYEHVFFLAEPDPHDIVIQEGNRLVLTSCRSGEIIPGRKMRMLRRVMERLSTNDVSGAAQAMIHLVGPLPPLDMYDIQKRLEERLFTAVNRSRNPGSPWVERTTLGVWQALLQTTREAGLPVRLRIVRVIRSDLNHAILAGQVWRKLSVWSSFWAYRSSAYPRIVEAERRKRERGSLPDDEARGAMTYYGVLRELDRTAVFVEAVVDRLDADGHAMPRKGAYAVAVSVQMGLLWSLGTLTWVTTAALRADPARIPSWTVLLEGCAALFTQPVYLGLTWAALLWTLRSLTLRLDDLDRDD